MFGVIELLYLSCKAVSVCFEGEFVGDGSEGTLILWGVSFGDLILDLVLVDLANVFLLLFLFES